jgi:hypothetical protein
MGRRRKRAGVKKRSERPRRVLAPAALWHCG